MPYVELSTNVDTSKLCASGRLGMRTCDPIDSAEAFLWRRCNLCRAARSPGARGSPTRTVTKRPAGMRRNVYSAGSGFGHCRIRTNSLPVTDADTPEVILLRRFPLLFESWPGSYSLYTFRLAAAQPAGRVLCHRPTVVNTKVAGLAPYCTID